MCVHVCFANTFQDHETWGVCVSHINLPTFHSVQVYCSPEWFIPSRLPSSICMELCKWEEEEKGKKRGEGYVCSTTLIEQTQPSQECIWTRPWVLVVWTVITQYFSPYLTSDLTLFPLPIPICLIHNHYLTALSYHHTLSVILSHTVKPSHFMSHTIKHSFHYTLSVIPSHFISHITHHHTITLYQSYYHTPSDPHSLSIIPSRIISHTITHHHIITLYQSYHHTLSVILSRLITHYLIRK